MNYDYQLQQIEGLKWLPWVGKNYFQIATPNRVLVVGESHYHDASARSIAKHEVVTFTREVIEEMAINRDYYATKIFQNLHRALFRNDEFNAANFWNLVSFYNFIQKPMNTNKGRPNYHEFFSGWAVFLKVIEVLKPSTCLFLGTEASNTLIDAFPEGGTYSLIEPMWDEKISGTYPRYASITDNDGHKTELIFIRHTSQYFSWPKWNDYLTKKMPQQLTWLNRNL